MISWTNVVSDLSSRYNNARVLVLGGAGFLGSHIVGRLAALGARVTSVDAMLSYSGANPANLRHLASSGNVELVVEDVTEMADLTSRLDGADVVFDAMGTTGHQWAYHQPELDLAANVTSHLTVLRGVAAASSKPHLVHLGTRAVYGRPQAPVVDEEHPREPIDIQGTHKLAAERHLELLADRAGVSATILRIGNCYGPGQRLSGGDVGLIGGFLRDIMGGGTAVVFGGPERRRDFLFADDLADAALAAGTRPARGVRVFNVAGSRERLVEVAEQTVSVAGRGRVDLAPFPEEVGRMDPGDIVLDCTRARDVLQWTAKTPFATGLDITIHYYASHARSYGLVD